MPLHYFDNNATTAAAPEVVEAMAACLAEDYGNPSSLHVLGTRAADRLAAARASVARLIGARAAELVFTSGGTESNQTAIEALARTASTERRRVVTSALEHPAVAEPIDALESRGFEVVRVGVDGEGRLDHAAFEAAVDDTCAFAAVMWANNEIGVVNDVTRLAASCHAAGATLFVDAVQAVGKLPVDVRATGVDLLALSGHKLHGPKGSGALYVRRGAPFEPLLRGGGQEDERRAGTQNVPAAVGLGVACELARAWLAGSGPMQLAAMRDRLEQGLRAAVSDLRLHGAAAPRTPNTSNLGFPGISGEALLMMLSEEGICVSTGSACSSGRHAPSPALLALGLQPEEASSTLRFSLSRETSAADVDAVLEAVPRLAAELRALGAIS